MIKLSEFKSRSTGIIGLINARIIPIISSIGLDNVKIVKSKRIRRNPKDNTFLPQFHFNITAGDEIIVNRHPKDIIIK